MAHFGRALKRSLIFYIDEIPIKWVFDCFFKYVVKSTIEIN